jgi:hypothetical protein
MPTFRSAARPTTTKSARSAARTIQKLMRIRAHPPPRHYMAEGSFSLNCSARLWERLNTCDV